MGIKEMMEAYVITDKAGESLSVTCKENLLRGIGFNAKNVAKTHCPKGHPYNEENTYTKPNGSRDCRICRCEARKRFTNKQKEEALL